MYISLGKEKNVNTDDIIAIFDLDITSQSHLTRKFLRSAEKEGNVVYLSQMATSTLVKRIL